MVTMVLNAKVGLACPVELMIDDSLSVQYDRLHGYKNFKTIKYRSGSKPIDRPQEVHANQGLKVGLYTPTILGGNSYLSWFYDRGAIKEQAHTGTILR